MGYTDFVTAGGHQWDSNGIEPGTLRYCCINLYALTTPLSAQIAEWLVHKGLCNKTVRSRVRIPLVTTRCYKVCVAQGVIAWELGQAEEPWPGD